jgi:cytochrome P450
MMFGSANRDERRWPEPERFNAARNPVGHLAFGIGLHNCPGQILARVETVCLLDGLVRNVRRIELGEPVWHLNNVIRGLEHLPVTLHA